MFAAASDAWTVGALVVQAVTAASDDVIANGVAGKIAEVPAAILHAS